MNRYKYQQVKIDKETGHRKLSTTEYAKIKSKNSDAIHIVKYGDSYGSLAQKFYSDTTLWWIIARANGEFQGNLKPKIGQRLIIPKDISDVIRNLNNLNSKQD
jgi:nucleoid-associated protein YgaU|tara:strand:+ start:148 stop:456 length:309 start_codon:yes stop_codon:yes gene_type:complete